MMKPAYTICLLSVSLLCLLSFNTNVRTTLDDDLSPVRTPAEEQKTFQIEPGLSIQLVASEPMVQEPVTMTFDADGRLWVVEMRGFMTDVDGDNEETPNGRVVVLEDTNGDGQMDKSHVYIDSLIMPRALALVPGGALIAENNSLWLTQDKNNDGKADSKTLIDPTYAANGLPEHSDNGLWRGMDNWYYSAKSRLRYRLNNGRWQRDSTEFRGQWGISHDDKGHLFYNYNWSQLHADLVPPNYLSRNKHHKPTTGIDHGLTIDRRVYPIRSTPAVNRGYIPGTLSKNERLLEFTAACSPLAYRGTALPAAYQGNAFVCEPAGNLIKRNVVETNGLLISAKDPHPGTEFLASTDERFRPVALATGPDGALYVADMYRGIVQHKAYMTPYLKEQTLARKLVQPVHDGRIWRIVPEGWQAQKPKKLSDASTADLVAGLSNPDGWHRDMAQRLLVERNDKSVAPSLTALAVTGKQSLPRFQALWTLDGLKLSNPTTLLGLVSDQDALVSTTAVRLLEPFAKTDKVVRTKLGEKLLSRWDKAPIEQVLQMALSAEVLDPAVSQPLLAGIVERYGESALIRDAVMSSLQNQEYALLQRLMTSPGWQVQTPAKEIFLEVLGSAIIRKGSPTELSALLTKLGAGNEPLGWQQKAIVSGLAFGGSKTKPVKLASVPKLLTRSANSLDPSRLASLNSFFDWPGHVASKSSTQTKSMLNADEQKLFASGRQLYLNTCSGCHGTDGGGLARFAPPLVGSEWVLGNEKRLALILLHGLEGPIEINKRVYDAPEIMPVMPSHSTMDDGSLTAILTYIRNEWGNNAGPMGKRTVSMTRIMSQGRVVPWTPSELNKYIQDAKTDEASGK